MKSFVSMKEQVLGNNTKTNSTVPNCEKPTLLRLAKSAKMSANASLTDIVRANIDHQRKMHVTVYLQDDLKKKTIGVKGTSVVQTNPSPDSSPDKEPESDIKQPAKKRITPSKELKIESDI